MIRCFLDDRGFRRADTGRLGVVVETFLEQDVQGSVATCDELLKILAEMEGGRKEPYSGTGNAHTVSISDGTVKIENDWDESFEPAVLTYHQFAECLREWRLFITQSGSK